MIYIRCVHCGTLDFDARFALRFHDHNCCSYNGPEKPVKKWKQLKFWSYCGAYETFGNRR